MQRGASKREGIISGGPDEQRGWGMSSTAADARCIDQSPSFPLGSIRVLEVNTQRESE